MRKLISSACGLMSAVMIAGAASAQEVDPIEFQEFTLDNGLHFIVHEDHSTPIVAVDVWYDVGSANDPEGRSGFAHLFEHMLFQETENIPVGRLMELVPEAGGTFNGTTSHDRTNYFEVLPSNRLNLALWMEAERMGRLVVSDENFQREREVVKEERRMRIENQPYAEAIGITLDTLGTDWEPYKRPAIGSMADLDAATVEDVRAFHSQYYNPINSTVVVAGDVTVDQVRSFAEEYFGEFESGPVPPELPPVPETPRTTGERRVTVEDDMANLPALAASYSTPPAGSEDMYALEILASIFSQGESSRLHERLVKEERAALAVQAGMDTRQGPGRLFLFALPNQGVELERLESLIQEEIDGLKQGGITDTELQKAKNQAISGLISSRQTVLGKAELLQQHRFFHGDASAVNTAAEQYRDVTLEDVERVAAEYLNDENRTVVIVVPESDDAPAEVTS